MKTTITLLTAFFTVSTLQSQDFWERTNSPGYQVPTIAMNSSGHLFAGIAGFGMFRSEDDGDTWTPINEGLTMPQVMKLAIDQVSGRIFASAFDLTGSQRGVFRSTDNGNSWKGIASLMNRGIYSMAINSRGHIFAGAFGGVVGGVLRSTDGGDTWTGTSLTSFVSNLAINSRGHIFACFTRFLYRSTDNGDSWSYVGPDSSSGLHCRDVAFGVNGDVFLTQHEPGELGWYGMMYRSTNNGDTWSVVRPLTLGGFGPLVVNANGHIFSGALCPSQSCVIRSSDNGTTWGDVGPGLPASYGVSTLVLNARGRIFASAGIAVYRSRLSTTSTKDEDADGRKQLPRMLRGMSAVERRVFHLYYWKGLSVEEIQHTLRSPDAASPDADERTDELINRVIAMQDDVAQRIMTPSFVPFDEQMHGQSSTEERAFEDTDMQPFVHPH